MERTTCVHSPCNGKWKEQKQITEKVAKDSWRHSHHQIQKAHQPLFFLSWIIGLTNAGALGYSLNPCRIIRAKKEREVQYIIHNTNYILPHVLFVFFWKVRTFWFSTKFWFTINYCSNIRSNITHSTLITQKWEKGLAINEGTIQVQIYIKNDDWLVKNIAPY